MAQRFGGKFSPGAAAPDAPGQPARPPPPPRNSFDGKRATRTGFRSNLLFIMPFLFVWKAFQGSPGDLLLGLGAFALLLGAAFMTREGLIAEEAYEARKVARRPALPRKIIAACATGLGLGLGAFMADQPALPSALLGLSGLALHLVAFGLDPMKDKGAKGSDAYQNDRVARAVETAEAHLAAMNSAILQARDRQLEGRVERFADTARQLFRTVEGDPGDLTAARKYLGIYLQGARDATAKFAELYARNRDPKLRADYEALLGDLETTFAGRTTALLSDNHTDLNVEIEVLRERLNFENH